MNDTPSRNTPSGSSPEVVGEVLGQKMSIATLDNKVIRIIHNITAIAS